MSGALVAGVDCSTQATKVLVVDPEDGRVVARGRAAHEVTGSHGARETHPDVWWRALALALGETGLTEEVSAISVAGQQHGLVALDDHARPLRPAVLWNDTRSAPEASLLTDALGGPRAWAEEIGSVPVASFTVTTWAWLRRAEPDVAASARALRLPHDYLTQRLTGRGVTDRGDASGTGWWATRDERYSSLVLDLPEVALDGILLPDVLGPREPAGEVTGEAARELGLRRETRVGPGTGDNMGAALGLGVDPGVPVISLGTSGTVYSVMTERATDEQGLVAGFADATGRFLPLAATLNATLAVDRIARWLHLDRDDVEPSDEVVVMPYFDGERTPNLPRASGTVTGLRHDTSPQQVLLATYEGVAGSLLLALDRLNDQGSGLRSDSPIVLVGGGARGKTWQYVVGKLSGRALLIPKSDELVALGAAVQAASVLHDEAPDEIARRWDGTAGRLIDPVPVDEEKLRRISFTRERCRWLNEAE